MTEIEKMSQRHIISNMMNSLSKEEQQIIFKDIEDLKNILNVDNISIETIALLIFLYDKTK